MEVYFVDVGLGSCHVILLGGRRALVVDCGVRSDHIALQFLLRRGWATKACLGRSSIRGKTAVFFSDIR